MLITMAAVICLGGASLLFLRGHNSRSKRILSGIMFAWGCVYVARIAGVLLENQNLNFVRTYVMDMFLLVSGNLYLIILLLYPLEVIRPGWLNLKRTFLLLSPCMAVILFYYIVLSLLGQEPMELYDMEQLIEHIGDFNVWFRFLMIFSIFVYFAYLFKFTWRYEECYRKWCSDNYSYNRRIDILWLRQYGIGVALIGVVYFLLLFNGSTCYIMLHNISVQCFFFFALYKGLFHENPYTESFFSQTLDEAEACRNAGLMEVQMSADDVFSSENESTFVNKLPVYRDMVAVWMSSEKPYLNQGFKLMDVSDVLPLNRTYLSRVFNEGFGDSFSNVVCGYRMREAEQMLVGRKDIPVGRVGELCGFSSRSTFYRSFVQSHGGLTPNRYRKRYG